MPATLPLRALTEIQSAEVSPTLLGGPGVFRSEPILNHRTTLLALLISFLVRATPPGWRKSGRFR